MRADMVDIPKGARGVRQQAGYTIWTVGDERAPTRDAFHTFLRMRWSASVLAIAAAVLLINLAFACAYVAAGGIDGARSGSLWDAFLFSVQTLGTIGYGVMHPKSDAANTIMILESITGIIVIAIITGLVFTKFSRPTARVAFSTYAVITPHQGVPTLMLRVGNRRSNLIVDTYMRVSMSRAIVTAEGERFYKLHDLRLVRDRIGGMRRGWTAMHVIDEASPLFGLDAEQLTEAEIELEVSILGIDDVLMQTVYSNHQYTDQQIKFGYRFAETLSTLPNGDLVFDVRNFDVIVPNDPPRDSVAA
jgi:inward rectifier potassium channel